MTEKELKDLDSFLVSLSDISWLAHAGDPHPNWIVVADTVAGYDGWNTEMLSTWSPRTHRLEQQAIAAITNAAIDEIFAATSERIGPSVATALGDYFDRRPNINESTDCGADQGLWPEVLDSIKRDVAWAAIEHVLHDYDFFTDLLTYYRAGRWPCGWSGEYPEGKVVVL